MSKTESKSAATTRKLLRQISQAQIMDYDRHKRDMATLKAQLKDKEEIVDVLEKSFLDMLERGFAQEDGDLRLAIDISTRKATPKYKELYAAVVGPKAVEEAQEAAGKTEYKHVNVVSAKPNGA